MTQLTGYQADTTEARGGKTEGGEGEMGEERNGADYRIRTDDLPLTRRLLYQLS